MNTIANKHSYVLVCKGENWKRLEQHQVEIISQKKYVVMVFFFFLMNRLLAYLSYCSFIFFMDEA